MLGWLWNGLIPISLTMTGRSRSITRSATLFKHPHLGVDDIRDMWASEPLCYPAKPPAHWLMVAEVGGQVLMVPLAPSTGGDPSRCRPIGCYLAADHLAKRFREDR
jgi:hypothetical protein